jgi:type IV secretion system protein VirB3
MAVLLTAMREIIYKGATRPPILWGVPMLPGLAAVGVGSVIAAWTAYALSSPWPLVITFLVLVPLLGWMKIVTKKDDQRVIQYFLWMQMQLLHRNRAMWKGCRSYTPIVYTGGRDVL